MKTASLVSVILAALGTGHSALAVINLSSADASLAWSAGCTKCLQNAVHTLGAESVETQARTLLQNINVFGRDDRVPQTRRNQANGFAAIGRVYTNRFWKDDRGRVTGQSSATAFLVSPCVALTNYHVVFGDRERAEVTPDVLELNRQWSNRDPQGKPKIKLPNDHNYSVTFMVGEKPDGTFKRIVIGRPYAFGDNDLGRWASDWVVLKFDEPNCPGADREIGYLTVDRSPSLKAGDRVLRTAGYPGRENSRINDKGTLYATKACSYLTDFTTVGREHGFTHDCASRYGQSGSPIMTTDSNGRMTVVGIIQGTFVPERKGILPNYDPSSQDSRTNANIAVGVRALLPEVAPLIAEDLAAHGGELTRKYDLPP